MFHYSNIHFKGRFKKYFTERIKVFIDFSKSTGETNQEDKERNVDHGEIAPTPSETHDNKCNVSNPQPAKMN